MHELILVLECAAWYAYQETHDATDLWMQQLFMNWLEGNS
jgi:hypothetical protein